MRAGAARSRGAGGDAGRDGGAGRRRGDIVAVIGPCISQAAYEVGPEFLDTFRDEDPENARFFANGAGDRMLFDLPGYGLHRLRAAGVGHAEWTRHCTYGDADRFYSYRRTTHAGEAGLWAADLGDPPVTGHADCRNSAKQSPACVCDYPLIRCENCGFQATIPANRAVIVACPEMAQILHQSAQYAAALIRDLQRMARTAPEWTS